MTANRHVLWSAVSSVLVLLIAVSGASAEVHERTPNSPPPISFSTQDPASFAAGGPLANLLRKAEDEGSVRLIVGLRTTLRAEHTLSAEQAADQSEVLRAFEDAVLIRVFGTSVVGDVVRFGFVPYISMRVNAEQLGRLASDPGVAWLRETVTFGPSLAESTSIIHAVDLWKRAPPVTGSGYHIAVLDTGVDRDHPMLAGKIKFPGEACYSGNHGLSSTQLSTCPNGEKSSTDRYSGQPCQNAWSCDHGTHVASIAAGKATSTSPQHLNGVAPDASIISIKAVYIETSERSCGPLPAPCVRFSDDDVILGLKRIYALRSTFKIAAVNISLAGPLSIFECDNAFPDYRDIFLLLTHAGIAPIVAAGNQSSQDSVGLPACISTAISVGAATKSDSLWPLSNNGTLVKVLAPGVGIVAALPNGEYGVKSGTSQAAPHVAAAFALAKEADSSASVYKIWTRLQCTATYVHSDQFPASKRPKPRLDVLALYDYVRIPPVVSRTWGFNNLSDLYDWTGIRGIWSSDGKLALHPSPEGWAGIITSYGKLFCNPDNSTHIVLAAIKRITPPGESNGRYASGIIVQAEVDYEFLLVSGYWIAFNNNGVAAIFRLNRTNFNLPEPQPGSEKLCGREVSINVNNVNTIRIELDAGQLRFFLNDQFVCGINKVATAYLGPVVLSAYIPSSSGHSFEVRSVQIKSLPTGELPVGPLVLDPTQGNLSRKPSSSPAELVQ